MISSPQAIAPKPALPPAAAAAANPAGGPSFAQFLNEQSSTPPAPIDADGSTAAADAAGESAQATGRQAAARRTAQARAQDRQNATQRPTDAAAQTAAPPKPEAEPEALHATETDSEEAPELKEFTQLIGLAQPPAALPPAQPADATAVARGEPAAVAAMPADTAATVPTPEATPRGPAERRAAASADSGRSVDAADAGRARLAEPRAEPKTAPRGANLPVNADGQTVQDKTTPSPATPAGQPTPSFAAALAQATPTPVVRTDATPGALTTAAVQAPLHSPAFAPELGTRVSLLAVDGLQRAELQLNPAEMGPVAVHIVLDGSQAQVSFHAQQAETRQVLEQSLPELAAALQGQGLTLSGGGVFQQAPRDADPGTRDGGPSAAGAHGDSADAGAVTNVTAATPPRRSLGLLDAFA